MNRVLNVLASCLIICNLQAVPSLQWALQGGISMAFGTHFQRVGLTGQLSLYSGHLQSNTRFSTWYTFRALGPPRRFGEIILSQGVVYCFGPGDNPANPFLSPVSNQTFYSNHIGYAYQYYFNRVKTSQATGLVSFGSGMISFIIENDLLGSSGRDRFRTGAVQAMFRYRDQWQASISTVLWTGEMGRKNASEDPRFRTGCYLTDSGGVYANSSHGLFAASFQYNLGLRQVAALSAGIDAERVRNVFQNKIMHDMVFLPKKWMAKGNCDIPMISQDSTQYLYGEGQKVRKTKAYTNIFVNPPVFY